MFNVKSILLGIKNGSDVVASVGVSVFAGVSDGTYKKKLNDVKFKLKEYAKKKEVEQLGSSRDTGQGGQGGTQGV